MPKLQPISQRKLVQKLRKLGFLGPYQAGKHPYMIKNDIVLTIPNPHEGDVSADLIVRILRQGNIKKDDWKNI